MPNVAESPNCAVAEALVFPRLSRVEQSIGATQDKFLDHDIRLQAIAMRHEEQHRRITLLEGWMAEQQAENRGIHRDIQALQAGVVGVTERLDVVRSELMMQGNRTEAMFAEVKTFFVQHSADSVLATETALQRHRTVMTVGMTLAFSVAGLVAVMGAMHAVFSGVPLAESIAAMMARLGL